MKNILFILILVISACQVQKRRYQPGYYVHHKKTGKHIPQKGTAGKSEAISWAASARLPKIPDNVHGLGLYKIKISSDSCDLLVFNDGTEIKAVIIHIGDKEVKYRYCDEPEDKVRTTAKKNIVQIRYHNSNKVEVLNAPKNPPATTQPTGENTSKDTTRTVPASTAPTTATAPVTPSVTTTQKDSASQKKSGDNCAIMYFSDGSEKKVNVLEIGVREIRYKDCAMPNGPLFIELKSKVFLIVYANGHREVIEQKPEPAVVQQQQQPRPTPYRKRKSITTGFVFSLLGFYPLWGIGGLVAIITSAIYLAKAKEDPEVYSQEGLAKATLILGIVSVAIIALIFLFAFLI